MRERRNRNGGGVDNPGSEHTEDGQGRRSQEPNGNWTTRMEVRSTVELSSIVLAWDREEGTSREMVVWQLGESEVA